LTFGPGLTNRSPVHARLQRKALLNELSRLQPDTYAGRWHMVRLKPFGSRLVIDLLLQDDTGPEAHDSRDVLVSSAKGDPVIVGRTDLSHALARSAARRITLTLTPEGSLHILGDDASRATVAAHEHRYEAGSEERPTPATRPPEAASSSRPAARPPRVASPRTTAAKRSKKKEGSGVGVLIAVGIVAAALWGVADGAGIVGDSYDGPPNGTAECNDGWISYSAHRQGACSWHGGVESWND
jgi:hypothetical protein